MNIANICILKYIRASLRQVFPLNNCPGAVFDPVIHSITLDQIFR